MSARQVRGSRQDALASEGSVERNEDAPGSHRDRTRRRRRSDEHGVVRYGENLLDGAPEGPRGDSTFTMAPEHGEVRPDLMRQVDDALRRVALLEPHTDRVPQGLRGFFPELLEIALRFLPGDFPAEGVVRLRPRLLLVRLHDVQERNVAPKRLRERYRVRHAYLGERGAVQAHENATPVELAVRGTRWCSSCGHVPFWCKTLATERQEGGFTHHAPAPGSPEPARDAHI